MATVVRVKKEDEEKGEKSEIKLTPELIRDRLFYFRDAAHLYHQETKGGWEHEALGELYSAVADFEDDIPEKIMGYMGGKRIGKLNKIEVAPYGGHETSVKLANDLIDFAYELYEWAGEKKYCDIENIAQSLSGVAAKTVYRLTLS